jgi:hypothetical protein
MLCGLVSLIIINADRFGSHNNDTQTTCLYRVLLSSTSRPLASDELIQFESLRMNRLRHATALNGTIEIRMWPGTLYAVKLSPATLTIWMSRPCDQYIAAEKPQDNSSDLVLLSAPKRPSYQTSGMNSQPNGLDVTCTTLDGFRTCLTRGDTAGLTVSAPFCFSP